MMQTHPLPKTHPPPKAQQEPLWLALRFPDLPYEVQGLSSMEDAESFEANKQLEQQALQQLQECCYHFSPYVEQQTRSGEPGLLLEVSRCLKLFKGMQALTKGLFKQLRAFSYRFEFGLAHSASGAWLLSWQQHSVCDNDDRNVFIQRLQQTPIHLLESNELIIDALDQTGFNTLGDVIKQMQHSSLDSLRKRFGIEFSDYLQDVLAIESKQQQASLFKKPVQQYQPTEYFCEHLQLDYPLESVQLLQPVLEILLQKLQAFLGKRQLHSTNIVWRLYDIYQNREDIPIAASQLRTQTTKTSWQLFRELSLIHFENKSLPFAVDTVELLCDNLVTLKASTGNLAFDGLSKNNSEELQITLARIKTRLGDDAIYKVSYHAHHVPEKSVVAIALNKKANTELDPQLYATQRPHWLLKTPQSIQKKEQTLFWRGTLEIIEGPERIEGYWWEEFCARDYYLALREDMLKLWIYQNLQNGHWYVHGVFA